MEAPSPFRCQSTTATLARCLLTEVCIGLGLLQNLPRVKFVEGYIKFFIYNSSGGGECALSLKILGLRFFSRCLQWCSGEGTGSTSNPRILKDRVQPLAQSLYLVVTIIKNYKNHLKIHIQTCVHTLALI